MRKLLLVMAVVLGAAAFAVPAAFADSPHFISGSSSIDSSGNLLCSFKEVGLGTISATSVTCTADATATYACINGGGNHPKATNKATVSGPVVGGGSFPVRNGQTTGTTTASPPGPGSFSCPSGQRLVLASVSYTNVTLHGEGGDLALADQSITLVNV
jgi:hypothetical protein